MRVKTNTPAPYCSEHFAELGDGSSSYRWGNGGVPCLVEAVGVASHVEPRVFGVRDGTAGTEASVLKVLLAHLCDMRMGPAWWWLPLLIQGRCKCAFITQPGAYGVRQC